MAAEQKSNFDKSDDLAVRTIRVLAADVVEKAKSGHPGAPMGLAAVAHVLWKNIMNGSTNNSKWINRDRFVLSNGHGCALQYSMLHLNGYKVAMDDLKQFRQLGSITPGHPEVGVTDGIEVSTGPLGQGIAQGVGLAMAGKHVAARFNKNDITLFDSFVYVMCGDGCLQEGVSSEASSLAGHLELNNLIILYDDNRITIDGSTDLSFSKEDVLKRYEAYGFNTYHVQNGNTGLDEIEAAIKQARADCIANNRPSFIKITTNIGYGSNKVDTHGVHGAPLGTDSLRLFKETMQFDPEKTFVVSDEVYQLYNNSFKQRGNDAEAAWNAKLEEYATKYADEGTLLKRMLSGELPAGWIDKLPTFDENSKKDATRNINAVVLNNIAENIPEFIGGSADLTPSTKTQIKCSHDFHPKSGYDGRYFRFGIREFGMIAICNGISAFGCNLIPFSSTFLVFISYGFNAVRLGSLSHLRQLYIMTHDSIFLGEDGPTHQPVEILPLLRATPNVYTFRPADGNEINAAYITGLSHFGGTILCLSRQKITPFKGTSQRLALNGAYTIINDENDAKDNNNNNCDGVIISTGSEVWICVEAVKLLQTEHSLNVRVVSAPCLELFDKQSIEYKKEVLGTNIPVISAEASTSLGWSKYSHNHIAVDTFGASAPLSSVEDHFGFTPQKIAASTAGFIKQWADRKTNGFAPPVLPACYE